MRRTFGITLLLATLAVLSVRAVDLDSLLLKSVGGAPAIETLEKMTSLQVEGTVRMNSTVRGPLNNPNVELALDYEGGKLAGKQIDRIQVKCLLKDRYLSVNDANVYTPVGILDLKGNVDFKNAFPDGWFRSHSAPDDIAYRLSIVQRNALLAHMPIKTPGLNGTIHGRIQIQGTGIHPKTLKAETDLELLWTSSPSAVTFHQLT